MVVVQLESNGSSMDQCMVVDLEDIRIRMAELVLAEAGVSQDHSAFQPVVSEDFRLDKKVADMLSADPTVLVNG
ncbi:unnamed protein product [Enterobius vermicularis]|uniref:Reverse transcriptase n=1 Tax=Enterobius vermicularis TaxID=51028 RepID=A0A0N4VA57_ENTVE|nr:unnamed protein product [Enterobius vermicularis]